jgi:hypothetical protein
MKKPNFKKAEAELVALGVPTYQRWDMKHFGISAEEPASPRWVKYYSPDKTWIFGVHPAVDAVLKKNGLHCQWENPGELGVYE